MAVEAAKGIMFCVLFRRHGVRELFVLGEVVRVIE